MQCFDTFREFLQKLYAATKWTGTVQRAHIIFSHDDWGGGQPGSSA